MHVCGAGSQKRRASDIFSPRPVHSPWMLQVKTTKCWQSRRVGTRFSGGVKVLAGDGCDGYAVLLEAVSYAHVPGHVHVTQDRD